MESKEMAPTGADPGDEGNSGERDRIMGRDSACMSSGELPQAFTSRCRTNSGSSSSSSSGGGGGCSGGGCSGEGCSCSCDFDTVPEDVLPVVMAALAQTASRPAQFVSASMACRAMRDAALSPAVLQRLGPSALLCAPERFSEPYRRFLVRCVEAGNVDAAHVLGMIEFYCLLNRTDGVRRLVHAARAGHADALYSLATIHFNGSGCTVPDRKLSVGVLLCASAAQQGHVAALRELGHCFQDGYGIKRNATEGRRLLMEANLRELVEAYHQDGCIASDSPISEEQAQQLESLLQSTRNSHLQPHHAAESAIELMAKSAASGSGGASSAAAPASIEGSDSLEILQSLCQQFQPLHSDWGCVAMQQQPSPIQAFLVRWNRIHGATARGEGLKECTNVTCGRTETRVREFRCCATCSGPSYCSRACQAADWKNGHMALCHPEHNQMEVD